MKRNKMKRTKNKIEYIINYIISAIVKEITQEIFIILNNGISSTRYQIYTISPDGR
jgi:hypothetical protein